MSGIYIHIPFCKQACNYCNFHFATSLLKKDKMLVSINKELAMVAAANVQSIHTIYFGGGTPSMLEGSEMATILNTIRGSYQVDANAEITLEANPDDLSEDKLIAWKAAGINRLSIGIQSFFEEDLQWMNRAHNAVQAQKGLELALQYFPNITIDLIYGTPGLTHDRWKQNVETAMAFNVPHLSCYALTVEPQTPLYRDIRSKKKSNVDEDVQSEQFLMLMDWARQGGYEHYEISNFARPGFRSKHNSAYWQGKPYIGIGPSAHSFNGKERRWNIANNQRYIDSLAQGQLPFEKEVLTPVQMLNEYIMIALRTAEGIELGKLLPKQKIALLKNAYKYIAQERLSNHDGFLSLTDQGKLYADGIAADLFFDKVDGT